MLEFELLGGKVHDMVDMMVSIAMQNDESKLPEMLKVGLHDV